jgi:hypothetical protein
MTPGQMEAAAAASTAGTSLHWVGTQAFQTYQLLVACMEPSQGRPKGETGRETQIKRIFTTHTAHSYSVLEKY